MEIEDPIINRLFSRLDTIEGKLDTTCERVTKMETKLDIAEKKKERNYKIGFAVIGIVFSLYAVITEFMV